MGYNESMTALADAVRAKSGATGKLTVDQMTEAVNGITSGGGMAFYKCASVDTANKTWTGYKALLTDGVYTFEENVTAGLTYGTGFTPEVKGIYDATASVAISGLWSGSLIPSDYIFLAPLDTTEGLTNSGVTFTLDSTLNRNVAVFSGSSYLSAQSSELDSVFTGGDFTFSCWLYQTGTSGIPYFYSNSSQIGFGYPASMSQFRIHKQGGDYNCSTSDISGRWVSVTLTYSNGKAQVYIGGRLNGEIDIDFDLGSNASTHYFGSWQAGEQPLPEGSKLCNLRVYDRVLSAKEIGLIAAEFATLPTDGLIFYAPLTERRDEAETGQSLSYNGNVDFTSIDNMSCASFGSYDYIETSFPVINSDSTVSLWIRYSHFDGEFIIFQQGASSPEQNYGIGAYSGNIQLNSYSNDIRNIGSPSSDRWYHIAVVHSGNTITAYMDGVVTYNEEWDVSLSIENSTAYINRGSGGGGNDGYISACRVYNRALTSAEISQLANEFTPSI